MTRPNVESRAVAKQINQGRPSLAFADEVQDTVQDTRARARRALPTLAQDRLSSRDAAIIDAVVRCRLLTYRQLAALLFRNRNVSAARRRIRALERGGWIASWELADRRGGHTRYVSATGAALRVVLSAITVPPEAARLVRTMRPVRRAPLELRGSAPKWLAHQRDVNEILVALQTSSREILWASSWECPLPARSGILVLPQPDYVLVERIHGQAHLIFGEHDRGTEPVGRFLARKVRPYSALHAFPEVLERTCGFRHFRVQVSVTDTARRGPMMRLRALLEASMSCAAPEIFSFTLGGWLAAFPDSCTWFEVASAPTSNSIRHADHLCTRAPAPSGSAVAS